MKRCGEHTEGEDPCLFRVRSCVSLIIQSPLWAHSDTCPCEHGFSCAYLHALSLKSSVALVIHTSPTIYSNVGDDIADSSLCEAVM